MIAAEHFEHPRPGAHEVRELRETVRALRAELERVRGEGETRLQDAAAMADGEIRHLRATIAHLRDQLDRVHADWEDRVKALESANRKTCRDLERTIKILHDRLQCASERG